METASQDISPLLYLGILLLAGYAGGRAAKALNLPRISGYIVTGMLLSPSVSGILPPGFLDHGLDLVTQIALAIIAFSIGGALELSRIRKLGRQILSITAMEALGAFALVSAGVIAIYPLIHHAPFGSPAALISVALLLGSICAATAPAAVLGVIHEYKAQGPMTTTLLGVVTLDDGIALILFSVAGGVAGSLAGGEVSWTHAILVEPGREIGLAMAVGGVTGLFLRLLVPTVRRKGSLLGISLGVIFTAGGLALTFGASPLLACMMLGFTLANLMNHPGQWFESVEKVEEPILAMFFVVAGAHLDISALSKAGALAAIIIFLRSAGKLGGGYLGGRLSGAEPGVRNNLPIGLLPQAGVSIGLVLAAGPYVGNAVATVMVNAILASVIMNELVSPALVRFALGRAGEIQISEEE